MSIRWSKYEVIVNINKYSHIENQDIDNMQIPINCIENPKEIIPFKVRYIYMDIYYQINRYTYMERVIDFDDYVSKMRDEHIMKYAELNASRILRGEKAIYVEFIAPNKPFLRYKPF